MASSAPLSEHHVNVRRAARFVTMGTPNEHLQEVWFVCHGYGELASTFIRGLSILNAESRLIVAPEALGRFYLDPAHQNVGASWMTREDRLNEIRDYLDYLDAVHGEILSWIAGASARMIVLGFSQGAATAARWACRGTVRAARLVLWGESLPPELPEEESLRRMRSMRLTLVAGDRDRFFTEERRNQQRERLQRLDVPFEELTFDGGHRLDEATLVELANRV